MEDGKAPLKSYYRGSPREWDYETWSDDLGRAAACAAQQDFTFAVNLVDRWLRRFDPHSLDNHGLYLHARSLVILGDLQRDRGEITGPTSARQTYKRAHQLFVTLDVPRRAAQVELSSAVVDEMSGRLRAAAKQYECLAEDQRLSDRDRARARLWVGTALTKEGDNAYAVVAMDDATRQFEQLEEPADWSVAHQKLALAHRKMGDLSTALRYIGVALSARVAESPMQRVRLDTAHAHILLSDKATARDGLLLLAKAAGVSRDYGMSHQLASIEGIRHTHEANKETEAISSNGVVGNARRSPA